ncbi:class I SAM-dependent rRNA methyltransferase [Gayadomonas joobiniege]|uniref:class I SAM-dependent rRNA methyltransferase n=1 Tax=Gayadomonas joobiniege TaxID=1234606 RepID=UPI000371FE50|nr:class I SAM-dependent methyltransferase [Gayadomonas joobiniege]
MKHKIILQAGREKALRRKHPWIFSRAIKKVEGQPQAGDDIAIYSAGGEWLATAAYSPASQIRARVWTFSPEQKIDQSFFEQRIHTALSMRKQLALPSDSYRLIAGENDGLPGLTIDNYAGTLVAQFLSAGVERYQKEIVAALQVVFPTAKIYERSDVDVRKKEGLKPRQGWLTEAGDSQIWITENKQQILVDIEHGHKTGFYLDQRENRLIAAEYCRDKTVLNCFSYTGTFGLHALQAGCQKLINLDVSQRALDTAAHIYQHNKIAAERYQNLNADVFKQLRAYREQGVQFDTIILDPPKFAENKNQLNKACRGYKDINMLALQILKPGGTLLTFSCSGLMESALFQKIVADAALDANVIAQIITPLSQAKDHPVLLSYPEGFYLKGLVVHKY